MNFNLPIVLAPLGGGPSTPELVAAVSGAGAFGFLGAPYMTPDEIRSASARIRELTPRPFGLNLHLLIPERRQADPSRAVKLLAPFHARLGLEPPQLPKPAPDTFAQQLEAVLDVKPAAFSFTFGIPEEAALRELKARGIETFGTATSLHEAELLAEAGVDGIVAQGAEAGGHRGTFAEDALAPTLRLVREIAAKVRLPLLATGGIMDGRDIRAALDAGAVAAQLGTAFLLCPESGASPAYKAALREASQTVLTRAFSGRVARGVPNDFTRAAERDPGAILPWPSQNQFTRPMRQAGTKVGDAGVLSLWAGTGVARIREMMAAELVAALARELAAVH